MFRRLFKSEHEHIEEMLSAYLDGELSSREQVRVKEHLAQCSDCAHNLHTLRQTVALLGQLPPVAVPRSFAIHPATVVQRPSPFQTRPVYAYLRGATALAAILLAVVVAGDAFLIGQAPYPVPARAPEAMEREAPEEKVTVQTMVVEEELAVEKKVVETVVTEREVVVEAPAEAPVLESPLALVATPSPGPAEYAGELAGTPEPLPAAGVMAKETEAGGASPTVEMEALAEASPSPDEQQIEATAMPLLADTTATAEPAFTPTAVAQALPPTPFPQKPTAPAAVQFSDFGLVLLHAAEIGLLALVLVLAIATLVARRRQGTK